MTSDCLSRLEEDGKQAGFDEEVLRDVSGVVFTGEFFSKSSRLYPHISSSALAATETVCRDSGP